MMKILESYKKMAKSMLTELAWDRKFGEPLPTLEDTTKKHQTEAEEVNPDKVIGKNDKGKAITVQMAMDYSGDNETMNTLKKKAQDVKPTDGEEEPKGKGLGPDDFERDFDDDSETGKDYVSKFQGTDEPEDDDEAKAQAMKDMEDEFDMEEETIEINGKQYKEVKEEKKVTKKHILREMYEKMGGK